MSKKDVSKLREDFTNLDVMIQTMKREGKSDKEITDYFIGLGYDISPTSILRLRREFNITETLARAGNSFRGKTHSEETRKRLSQIKIDTKASKGINNYFYGRTKELSSTWKGGITTRHDLFFGSSVWKQTRKFVLKHDDYSCIICGAKKDEKRLSIHHLRPMSERWDLRLDPKNLATLCNSCHRKTFDIEGMWIKNLENRLAGSWRYDEDSVAELEKARSPLV